MNNRVRVTVITWVVVITVLPTTEKAVLVSPSSTQTVVAENCTKRCGNVEIWYPFGMEEGCYLKVDGVEGSDQHFKINCRESSPNGPPKPVNWNGYEVLSIAVNSSQLRLKQEIAYTCFDEDMTKPITYQPNASRAGEFTFSSTKNIIVVMGCNSSASFSGYQRKPSRRYYKEQGCAAKCWNLAAETINGDCDNDGGGCCQIPQPPGLYYLELTPTSFSHNASIFNNPCTSTFMVENQVFSFYKTNLTLNYFIHRKSSSDENWVPVVVDWSIFTHTCSACKAQGRCLCKDNTICAEPNNMNGYICKCKQGFHGNPYHPHGCIDFDECKYGEHNCEKTEYCVNSIGDHHCQCPQGYSGKGTKTDHCVSRKKKWLIPVVIAASGSGGVIILLGVASSILYIKREKRKLKKMQERFFRENGGVLLSQKLLGCDVGLKIFTTQDLINATNNYNDKYIIGKGGFGVVYKGTLPNNQHVAIKRSLKVDPNQVEQFINEIIVLSQINNRNVVKLLGCCLETEVPFLVYEFITNGTLYDHLNDVVKASLLTWSTRVQIAIEVAYVLSYLHKTISPPIIHRDMKSMNILLDDNYTAKVADFGASRMVPINRDQLSTNVLGTWGYLDPEYMQTSELTEKSDVYSFGVVLVEILTRKKAISNDRPEGERFLAMHFIVNMAEGNLFNILDKSIIVEEKIEQIQLVANLAKRCLMQKGENRPTMKEVVTELEKIKANELPTWTEDDEYSREDVNVSFRGEYRQSESTGDTSGGVDSDLYDPRLFSISEGGR